MACAALGVSRDETDVLAELSRNTANPVWKQPLPGEVLEKAELLKGLPSHLMPHPCGVVVGDGLIASAVPVEMCSGGLPVTQLDMHGVEYLGLIKMDLLGQRGLTALALAGGKLVSHSGVLDGRTMKLINRGGTIGVPHIESPAMRGLLRRMNITSVEDVARALALVRPGAASGGGRDRYMAGGEKNVPPQLGNILRENRGVMLYQENVTEAACALMGLPPAEGDLMRRRLKRGEAGQDEVLERCVANGLSLEMAERGWELLSGYAGYGFCKAHAMTYASIASTYAAIKAERPAGAMAAFLAAGGGFYRHMVYIEEARRLGLKILPPDVNDSSWFCVSPGEGSIMIGMGYLAGMGETEFEKLKSRKALHPSRPGENGWYRFEAGPEHGHGRLFRFHGDEPTPGLMVRTGGGGGPFSRWNASSTTPRLHPPGQGHQRTGTDGGYHRGTSPCLHHPAYGNGSHSGNARGGNLGDMGAGSIQKGLGRGHRLPHGRG